MKIENNDIKNDFEKKILNTAAPTKCSGAHAEHLVKNGPSIPFDG